ncbi:MAG: biotin--[acetyl-CoA-carboxylase] ligase [Gemmatimonadaceae bacterium]|nr:biotin--[acetyl-CoA-carboxylase] ligase [Gemmatimonadaceae bacterium]
MSWLGLDGVTLAARLGLPRVEAVGVLGSTMDAAHELAAGGAPAGTLVVAEEQSAGRGRGGRVWTSGPGAGLWMTLVERPRRADGVDVLSLRVGLRLAPVLERWTVAPIRLKWPNDLYVDGRKLAGVLIEARWRGAQPDWIAIGLGLNLVAPPDLAAAALLGARAETVLAEVVPALRAAAFARGPLSTGELAEFARRDLAMGQRVSSPAEGLVRGISSAGELLVETDSGITPHRAGSLVFAIS